jgi:hypothetical protein
LAKVSLPLHELLACDQNRRLSGLSTCEAAAASIILSPQSDKAGERRLAAQHEQGHDSPMAASRASIDRSALAG